MNNKIERNYLEINSIKDLKDTSISSDDYQVQLVDPINFQLNKFFYKNIGKNHKWVDRLVWTDKQWIDYASNTKVKTYILKNKQDLAGYFELIMHDDKNEVEIAYFGLLEEYRNQKLGSYLLSNAIKNSFLQSPRRVWVHTCSLDHKFALANYLSKGFKVFKKEQIEFVA